MKYTPLINPYQSAQIDVFKTIISCPQGRREIKTLMGLDYGSHFPIFFNDRHLAAEMLVKFLFLQKKSIS